MMHKAPVKSVPSDLLYAGYCWETTREVYFARHNNWAKASDCRELRKLYAHRLWEECGVTVNPEEGFSC